jgi:hypothetical protein
LISFSPRFSLSGAALLARHKFNVACEPPTLSVLMTNIMTKLPLRRILLRSILFGLCARCVVAQSNAPTPNDSVRVSVTLNEDGSRTTYEFDPPNHKATSTTTSRDGKPQGKIQYVLDDEGRFGSGRIFGPDGKFRFRSVYKYDAAGRLLEENQFGPDDQLVHKIRYTYDAAGKQSGYSVLDGSGKIIGQTSSPVAAPPAKPRKP